MVLVLVFERGVDAGHVRDGQDVLNPSSLDGAADAALSTASSRGRLVVVVTIAVLLVFYIGKALDNGTGNATMDAEYVLVNDGRQGHAIEGLVRGLPDAISQLVAEAIPALPKEAADAIVLLPV